jgi:uncharacterized membrane protein YbhN (UPF0104 family)
MRSARWVAVPAIALAFLAVPPLAGIPGRLIQGCGDWIGLTGVLEALSVLGFLLAFKLVFGARMSWRQASASGLRALGASSLLPAGNIIGPVMGARSSAVDDTPLAGLTRATIALTVITLLPGLIVLGALAVVLWLGLLRGPHDVVRTLPAAGFTLAMVAAVALIRRSSAAAPRNSHEAGRLRGAARQIAGGLKLVPDGVAEARSVLAAGNWKLLGAVGYYAFDNAVLWAAFHAYGHAPAPSVIVMGYLVGSLGSAVPAPAGLGAVEGGLIGALVLYGAPAGPAAAAVLLYRGVSLLLPITLSACAWALLPAGRLSRRVRRLSPTAQLGRTERPEGCPAAQPHRATAAS